MSYIYRQVAKYSNNDNKSDEQCNIYTCSKNKDVL